MMTTKRIEPKRSSERRPLENRLSYVKFIDPLEKKINKSRSPLSWWLQKNVETTALNDSCSSASTLICKDICGSNGSLSSLEQSQSSRIKTLKSCLKVRTQACSESVTFGSSVKSTNNGVRWSKLNIALHEMILGDNPAVSAGNPVCLAWKSFDSVTCTIDEYESSKSEARSMQQMLLPSPIRFDILRHVGYSRQELQTAAKQVSKIRERRQKSSNELAYKIRRWLKSRKVLNKESTSHT